MLDADKLLRGWRRWKELEVEQKMVSSITKRHGTEDRVIYKEVKGRESLKK